MVKKLIVAFFALALAAGAGYGGEKKPNVVLILTDDMNYKGLSATGNETVKTPHIDSIFSEGVFFTDGYVTHAVCAPSRAGLLTGRYQARYGYETLSGTTEHALKVKHGVNVQELFISDLLKREGYATCTTGKWHLGANEEFLPNARGFDHWLGFRGRCDYFKWDKPGNEVLRNGVPAEGDGYTTEAFAKEAAGFIRDNKDRPFFVYFAPSNVHSPYRVPEKYIPEGGDDYDGMLVALDVAVGVLLKQLEDSGVADNTIVVFLNDNGGTKIRPEGNLPYRGGKATYFEGGVRVPFAIKWPGVVKPGTTYSKMVSSLDLLPTLVAAAGGTLPVDREYDGVDLKPYLTGNNAGNPHEVLCWRSGGSHAIRMGNYKMVWERDRVASRKREKAEGITPVKTDLPNYADRGTQYYLKPMLFDLSKDIGETKDISDTYPEKVKEMIQELDRFDTLPAKKQYGIK